jgi:hypothetical protein
MRQGSQVTVGCGNDPDVELAGDDVAQPSDLLFLQDAEELYLESLRSVRNLIQEQNDPALV